MSLSDLHSARLQAVPWQELAAEDLEALFAPEVVRWLPGQFQDLENDTARRAFLNGLARQAEVVALLAEGQGAGLVILSRPSPDDGTRHLGYLFAEPFWGQGLASEVIAALQAQFRGTGVTLSGGVMPENAASARVLEKAGFEGTASGDETVFIWHAGKHRAG
ncbi:GNAT family N-acetyltransferase [Roseobacteraceae bacterium NS-SX3]